MAVKQSLKASWSSHLLGALFRQIAKLSQIVTVTHSLAAMAEFSFTNAFKKKKKKMCSLLAARIYNVFMAYGDAWDKDEV